MFVDQVAATVFHKLQSKLLNISTLNVDMFYKYVYDSVHSLQSYMPSDVCVFRGYLDTLSKRSSLKRSQMGLTVMFT